MIEELIEMFPFLTIKNVLIYFLCINVIGFLAMFIDKKKAERRAWRISEKALILLTMFGGWIGTFLGMKLFRHKTQKPKFYIGIPVIMVLEIVGTIYIIIA